MAEGFTIEGQAVTADNATLTFTPFYPTYAGGASLVAVFASTATSNDFTTLPATIQDSNGFIYNLMFTETGANDLAGFNCVALYVCPSTPAFDSGVLTMPVSMQPGDVLNTYAVGSMIAGGNASYSLGGHQYATGQTGDFVLDAGVNTGYALVLGASFDAASVGQAAMTSPAPLPETGSNAPYIFWGFGDAFSTHEIDQQTNVAVTAGMDVFAFYLMLNTSNSTGGSNAQKLIFSINKGPLPIPPKEGRAIATVQIDCTQQLVQPLPINFPEYAYFGDFSNAFPEGFVLCEFDLEHLFQGAGLSEVRTLMAWSRPNFNLHETNREDVSNSSDVTFPAFITNVVTLQTIALGISASGISDNSDANGSYLIMPYPANKNALKYRFICPQANAGNPIGKFTLQFLNFEVMGAWDSGAAIMFTGGSD